MCSSAASGKHTSAVWQLRWVEKDHGTAEEHAEVLVSVSTDGRVTQWAIRKGFEYKGIIIIIIILLIRTVFMRFSPIALLGTMIGYGRQTDRRAE